MVGVDSDGYRGTSINGFSSMANWVIPRFFSGRWLSWAPRDWFPMITINHRALPYAADVTPSESDR